MKMRKGLSISVALTMVLSFVSGCTSKTSEKAQSNTQVVTSKPAEEKKPVLKILMPYQPVDPKTDKGALKIKEKSGWEVEYFMLPQQNPDEKLMMEMAAGNEYDLLLKIGSAQFAALSTQDTLADMGSLIDQYGSNIKNAVSDLAWKTATVNGKRVGIPIESGMDKNDPTGLIQGGIAVRSDVTKELGLTLPTDLDGFTEFLKKIKAGKNIEPLTAISSGVVGNNPFGGVIASAFGLGHAEWYDVNGTLVHRTKMPQYVDYIKYYAQLYKDGLLDKEFPINKQENINQKFTTGKSAVMYAYVWDVPTLLSGIQKSSPDAQIQFIPYLNGKSGKPYISLFRGVFQYYAIPRTSKNAEYVVKYLNRLSESEFFLSTYLGDKGVHYEVKDGKYFPLLPAFNEMNNAKQFTGICDATQEYAYWQARVRKTPEMAAAYEAVNANINKVKDSVYVDASGYANGVPAVQKYKLPLNKAESDFIVKAVTSGEPVEKVYDEFIKDWEKKGGTELIKGINDWYKLNKDTIK